MGQGQGKLTQEFCLPTVSLHPKLTNVNKKAPTLKADADHPTEVFQGTQCKVRQAEGSRAILCDAEPQSSQTGQTKGEPYLPCCSLK